MAEGLTNTGIAKRLCVSERTVEAHVRHVLKLDINEERGGQPPGARRAHLSAGRDCAWRTARPARQLILSLAR